MIVAFVQLQDAIHCVSGNSSGKSGANPVQFISAVIGTNVVITTGKPGRDSK